MFSRDMSSELRAEIINESQPTQTSTHTCTRAHALTRKSITGGQNMIKDLKARRWRETTEEGKD